MKNIKQNFDKKTILTWAITIVLILFAVSYSFVKNVNNSETDKARINSITKQLRCLECEGLSVYDSDTPISVAMKKQVAKDVKNGKSKDEIIASFVNKYGEFVRLNPTGNDGNWAVYVFPVLAVVALLFAIFVYTRKVNKVKIPKFKVLLNIRVLYWVLVITTFCSTLIVYKLDVSNKEITPLSNNANTVTTTQDPDDLRKSLESALKADPSASNYRALGVFQFAQDEYLDALKNLDKAVELDPSDATSSAFASYIVFTSGQYESARQRATKALALDPNNVTALFYHGLILREIPTISDEQKAQYLAESNENFDAVIRLDPTSEFARQINAIRS